MYACYVVSTYVPVAAAGYEDTKGFSASLLTSVVQAGCSGWRRAYGFTQEFGTVAQSVATCLRAAAAVSLHDTTLILLLESHGILDDRAIVLALLQVSPVLVIKAAARENAAWVNGASASEAIDAAQNVRTPLFQGSATTVTNVSVKDR